MKICGTAREYSGTSYMGKRLVRYYRYVRAHTQRIS